MIRDVVEAAFRDVHEGRSSDDVIIDDELNKRFLETCHRRLPKISPSELNWALINLRKASGLGAVTTKRRLLRHGDYLHAAEVAARILEDKYGLNTDRILCSPSKRREFDQVAVGIAPDVSPYCLRKAALSLRKRRKLKPELIKRVAEWKTRVKTYPAQELVDEPEKIPRDPGVYIFRDKEGFLYIGEAGNLRLRVTQHLDHSDRKALARYLWGNGVEYLTVDLHIFDPHSAAKKVEARRAYESDLIASRRPKFNLRP